MKNIIIPMLACTALLSCQKEESVAPCPDPSLIRQVNSGDLAVQQITYDENCLVHEFIETFAYTKYSYDQSNRIDREEHAISLDPASCYMPQGIPGETVTDPREAEISGYSVYEYDASGKLKSKSNYYVGNTNILLSVSHYEYLDDRIVTIKTANPEGEWMQLNAFTYDQVGNLTRDDFYLTSPEGDPTLNRSTVYEFDDRNNPFSVFTGTGEPGINTNLNNIIKETATFYNAGNVYQYVTEYRIEYDPSGYPVKVNDLVYKYGN